MNWDSLIQQPLSFWALAILGVWLTGVSKSGFAGGTGVVAVPLMAIAIEPKLAAAMLLPLLLFMDLSIIRTYRSVPKHPLFGVLMMGSVLGILLGTLVFRFLSNHHIKLAVGLLGIWFAVANLRQRQDSAPLNPNKHVAGFMGAVSGFTSFIAHAGGPPLTGYLLHLHIPKQTFLATATLFLALTNFLKLPAYVAVGVLDLNMGLFTLLLLPIAWLGLRAGVFLKDKLPQAAYVLWMNLLLLLVSGYLLVVSTWHVFKMGW